MNFRPLNYRHAYHAGNFADVLKHVVLVACLEALKSKQTPFAYIDTHAGAGRYDLGGIEAQKTGEFRDGIKRLFSVERLPTLVHAYLNLVRSQAGNAGSATEGFYPGSPAIAAALLRDQDRLQLCEIQEAEYVQLRNLFRADGRVAVHQRDGYQALRALLPPVEKRGLVLIDPPFEAQAEEFRVIERSLNAAIERWPNGVFAVWYPIKLRQHIVPFHRWLQNAGLRKVLIAELLLHPDNSALRLNGCGMALINAPYRIDRVIGECLPVIAQHLAQSRFSQHRMQWLTQD